MRSDSRLYRQLVHLISLLTIFLALFLFAGYFSKDVLASCNVTTGGAECIGGPGILTCDLIGSCKVTRSPVGWGQCGCGSLFCNWVEVSCGGTCSCGGGPGGGGNESPPQCSTAPLVMIDKSDGAGFKWYGTSVQIPYTTHVCY